MSDINKTPLSEFTIRCIDCGEENTLQEANDGLYDYHQAKGGGIARFPKDGLDDVAALKFKNMSFRCECCHEEYVENHSSLND